MPRGLIELGTIAGGTANVPTTAETVVGTATPVSVDAGQMAAIDGTVDLTTGAATTAVTVRVRRGSVNGTLVGTVGPVAAAAATRVALPFAAVDNPGAALDETAYVVTVAQTAATGNGTANTCTG